MEFASLHQLKCHTTLSPHNPAVSCIRAALLRGDQTPVVVIKNTNGGFEVTADSGARYLAHILEDFDRIPITY